MTTARYLFEQAGFLLSDESHARWTLPELCRWLNEGQRAIILAKPSARSETIIQELAEGTLQMVPTTGTRKPLALLRVIRNLKTTATSPRVGGRIIRPATRAILDATSPNWHDTSVTTPTKEVRNAVFDEELPLEYYVYPPNDGTGIVELAVSAQPQDVEATGATDSLASYEVEIDLPEPYSVPLLDYMLFRSQNKDDVTSANAQATPHYQRFASALGIKIQVERATSPNSRRPT